MNRNLTLTLTALAGLCLLTPSVGLAQFNNQVGLYADSGDLTTTSMVVGAPGPVDLYLVLVNPYREAAGLPVDSVAGFECMVDIPDADTLLGFTPEGDAVSLGNYPEIVVGYGTPLTVSGGSVLLGTLGVLTQAEADSYFYLDAVFFPSLPEEGTMAFAARVGTTDEILPMYPISGDTSNPVFAINGVVVDAVSETWGGVKSLFQ